MSTSKKLFSKMDKVDKATSMGEEGESVKGIFGIKKNNKEVNSKKKKKTTKKGINEKPSNDNETKIERASNEYLRNTPKTIDLAEMQKETNDLQMKIKELEESLDKERKEFIEDIKFHDNEYDVKNTEVKKLSNKFNKKLEILKNYEKSLKLKTKMNEKSKSKSEEDIKKEIKIIEARIKVYENRANIGKEDYISSLKRAEIKENQENNLEGKLKDLNEEIKALNNIVKDLRITKREHLSCSEDIKKLVEDYKAINKIFQCEIKRAKQLALTEIKENDENNDEKGKDEKDNEEKALKDEKSILPKIQTLNFSGDLETSLEVKIIRKNKIGQPKNNQNNAINLYKKLSKEYNDNERYIKEANKNIHINNNKMNNKTEENYLFKDYETIIMQKVLPKNLIVSYQDKYNSIIQERNNIRQKFINESHEKRKENLLKNNQKDFNNLKIKEVNQKHSLLNQKYHKLKEKIYNIKGDIKEIEKQIIREDEKIKMKDREKKRIEIYYKGLAENKNKNKNNQEDQEDQEEKEEKEEQEDKEEQEEKEEKEEQEEEEEKDES